MTAIATLPVLLQTGTHGSRPAASAVGSGALYFCTTHSLIYQQLTGSWGTFWTFSSGASLTNTQVFLGADVNMPTANTFYDGPTYTPAAGTWLITCDATILNSSGGGQRETFKIWDGTTAYKAGQESSGGSTLYNQVSLSVIVSASGSQTFKMSVAGNGGTQTMMRHPDTNNTGLTGLGTSLLAVKIG